MGSKCAWEHIRVSPIVGVTRFQVVISLHRLRDMFGLSKLIPTTLKSCSFYFRARPPSSGYFALTKRTIPRDCLSQLCGLA